MLKRMVRGRKARHPTAIPLRGWLDIAVRIKDEVLEDNIGLIAAGVAFYALLALFPAIAAAVALAGLVTEPEWIVGELDELTDFVPTDATNIIIGQATAVAGSEQSGLGLAAIIGLALALYSSSRGMASLMTGLNITYDEKEKRGFFRFQFVKLGLTLFVIFGVMFAAAVSVVIPTILHFLGLPSGTDLLIRGISWMTLFVLACMGLAFIYRKGPSRSDARWDWLAPGTVLAVVFWVIGSRAFGYYVQNFGSYNETFGTLGGAIVLMMWLWLSAYIVLLGAEVNAEIEAQTKVDTTTGPDAPMGRRGAVKADTLGKARV